MKPFYLLDANVIAELIRTNPNQSVVEHVEKYESLCAISATAWNELLFGVQRMTDEAKKALLLEDLIDDIQANYPIISYDKHAAWIQADICARLAEASQPIDFQDTQIASIAIANNMILVTRNTSRFEAIQKVAQLTVENWFEE